MYPGRFGRCKGLMGSCTSSADTGVTDAAAWPSHRGSMMEESYGWYVGIDWGSEAHEVCCMDAEGGVVERRSFRHSGQGLKELSDRLTGLAAGERGSVAVAIEVPHGAVVETLLERGFAVYSLNPKQADRFRDRFSPAGAKDDRRDAMVLASALRTDRQHFRPLVMQPEAITRLRELVRVDEELRGDKGRLTNQLYAQLLRFYPQILELSSGADDPWVWELLRRAPTPERGARLREATIAQILRRHRIRRLTAADVRKVLAVPALFVAPGTAQAAAEHIDLLLARLGLVHDQIRHTERRTDELFEAMSAAPDARGREHRDVDILQSMPGIGRKISATMLAMAPEAIEKADYDGMRTRWGVAPVTVASGKSRRVQMRRACDARLSRAVNAWAGIAAMRDPAAKAHYARLRASGHNHNRALRGVADRLLRILCAMLKNATLYDPNRCPHHDGVPAQAA